MKLWVVVGVAVTVMSVTVAVVGVAVTVVGGDGPQLLAKTTGSPRKPDFSSPSHLLPLISKNHQTYNHDIDFPSHNTSLHNHNTSSHSHNTNLHNHNTSLHNHNTSLHNHYTSSHNHESSHYNHNPSCLEHNISLHNLGTLIETVNKKGNIYKMIKEHVGTGVLNVVVQYFFDKLGTLESRSFGTTYIGDVAFYQSHTAEDATYHQPHNAEDATYHQPVKSTYPEPPYSWYHGGERKDVVKTPVRKQKHGGACIDAYTNFHSSSLCVDVSTALAIVGLAILLQLFLAFSVELVCPNSNFGSFDDVVFSVRNENNVTVDYQGGNQTQDQTQGQDQMQDEFQYQDQYQDEYQNQDQSEYQYEYQEQYENQYQSQDAIADSGNDDRVIRDALRSRMFPSLKEWSGWTMLQDMSKSMADSRFLPKAAFFCSSLRGFVDG